MKIHLSLLLAFLTITTTAAAKPEDPHLLHVRVNGLEPLSEKLFPRITDQLGLDHLRVPDQRLVDTRWKGYAITVALREIKGSIPLSPTAPYTNRLSVGFKPGNTLGAELQSPETRVTMKLKVAIKSRHWYQPGIEAEFNVTGHGLTGAAAVGLALDRGDFKARSYSLSKLEIAKIEVENTGLLSKLFGTVLRHTNLCGGARSLEDCLARVVNGQMARMLTPEKFLKPLIDPLLVEISGATRAIFTREDKLASSYAALESFQTGDEAATLSWGIRLKPKGAPAICSAALVPSPRERREAFDWNRKATGDLELALPQSLAEDYLYAFARKGSLCLAGQMSYSDIKFDYELAPAGAITIATGANGELMLRIPLRASLASVAGERGSLEAKNLHGALEIAFELSNDTPKGLCIAAHRVALVDLEGSVAFSGLRIPLVDLQGTLEQELNVAMPPKLGKMCFLPKLTRLNPNLAVELGDRVEAAPAHLWTSFDFR
jgi:hypothetical protein